MVVMSIKISDGSVPRSRNENGSCSVNGAESVRPVKWKRRNVSAIRDFPPGCGPVLHPIRGFPPGCGTGLHPVNVVVPNEAEPVSNNHVVSDAGSDVPVGLVVENVGNSELPVGDNHVVSDTGSDVPVGSVVENVGNSELPVVDNFVVSDAGSDEQVGSVVENVGNSELPVVDNHVASDAGTDEPLVGENVVNNEVQNGDVQVDNGGSVIKEVKRKMKYKPRKVSAVRNFPPFCGLNADEPTEEERMRINGRRSGGPEPNESVKDDLVHGTQSNEDSRATEEMQMIVESKVDDEDGKIKKCESSKKVQNIGQACQELVVYTRDKDMKNASPVDDAHDVDCEEDVRDNTPLSLTQKDMNIKNREVGSKKHVKKRPLDDTKYPVYMGGKIKVVMGLKAPSLSAPDIQQKDVTNDAKFHASVTPKIKQEKFVGESSSAGKVAYTGTLVKAEKKLATKGKGDASMTPKRSSKKKQKKVAFAGPLAMVVRKEEDFVTDIEEEDEEGLLNSQGTHDVDVSLPPFGPKSLNDARTKVRQTLRLFQALCRKLLQGEEAKTNDAKLQKRRVDLRAKDIMDKRGRTPVLGEKTYGPVPGVEVGDEFQYRVELALVGIHRPFQGGIDFVKKGKEFFAVSVVASGGYDNDVNKPDCLMYSGAGGVIGVGKDKSYENQKLERGNLALHNNVELKYPVRVIRGYKVKPAESSDSKSKTSTTYIYDGLYTVESCKQETGGKGTLVYKFELKRVPGQPQLAKREVTSKKFKTREGICVKDISNGKEVFPICAINTIDDEKPPPFTYITKIMYPDWYKPIPPKGCDCVGRCSEKKCPCAFKNGGEIPYNRNGAIVEAKPLVYECGPSCRCPPSCYNRATQHGMKIHLEIFKTESRGWGVRSLSSISSGSFICEYIGELLEESEAEKRKGNDEYLFDIGQNYNDCSLNPDTKPEEVVNEGCGFTIDAANYGNVGRFINHSCSPNLYAQNVVYDEDDKRMPRIMLFAAENIPPLQELTYHYNYAVDTVHDADGNIKIKSCYCGSSECTGRLY